MSRLNHATARSRAARTAFGLAVLLVVPGCTGGSATSGVAPRVPLLAFATATGIHLVRADGTGLRQLTRPAGRFAWSPDGTEIVFEEDLGGRVDLFVVDVAGPRRPARLTRGGLDRGPAWSPDGRLIAFAGRRGISVVAPDGSGLRPVVRTRRDAGELAWSPDGRRIAFSTVADGIHVVGADGREERRLVALRGAGAPAWSPRGDRIVFHRPVPGGCRCRDDVYAIRADGSGLRRLGRGRLRSFLPVWSPDGARIAFVGSCDSRSGTYDGRLAIHVMAPDGRRARRLTPCWETADAPAWSPDGKRIAFDGAPACFTDDCRERGLYIVAADGTGLRRVARSTNIAAGSAVAWQPAA